MLKGLKCTISRIDLLAGSSQGTKNNKSKLDMWEAAGHLEAPIRNSNQQVFYRLSEREPYG